MIYLTTLNNETSTLLTILMFASVIVLTTATLCQYFGRRKLKFDIFVFRNILYIILFIILDFIFFSSNSIIKHIALYVTLGCFAGVVLLFDIFLMCKTKNWWLCANLPFLAMLLPFWGEINPTLATVFVFVAVAYLFCWAVVSLCNSHKKLKNEINFYSLKEALDNSENAILFEDKFNVVYENIAMKKLLTDLNINTKATSKQIWQQLGTNTLAKVVDDQNILVFLNNIVYSFNIIPTNNKTQIVAFDITQEFCTTQKISQTKEELKHKQAEICQMIDNIDELEKHKEVLKLKSQMHDILGQRLFILHYILENIDNEELNLIQLKQMLSSTVAEMENDEQNEIQKLKNSVVSTFLMIGFEIVFSGDLPQQTNKAMAILKIVRECATNAIRHANATKLLVKLDLHKAEITDNGKPTKKEFKVGTGISGMRESIESVGGKLKVLNDPKFTVVLTF